MSLKQILVILGVLSLTLLLTMGGFLWVYKNQPAMLGIKPPPKAIDSVAAPVIDSAFVQKAVETKKAEVETLWKKRVDSLNKVLEQATTSLSQSRTSGDSLQGEIQKIQQKKAREEDAFALKMDSLTRANYQAFAAIYNGTNPTEVARILQNLDGREAAVILKFMKKKQAGKVLEAMQPEQAANILRLSSFDF